MDIVEQVGARNVDQPDARADECEWARVREATGLRRGDVDDHADTGLGELLRRDAVEIGVVDDRDVVGGEPFDEVLGAPVELRVAR